MTLLTPFTYANKILGAIAAMILYPIKSIIVNLGIMLLTLSLFLLIALAGTIIIPIMIALDTAAYVKNFIASLLVGIGVFFLSLLLVAPIIFIVVVPITFIVLLAELCLAIIDFFKSIYFGATNGFANGLFFGVIVNFFISFTPLSTVLQIITQSSRGLPQPRSQYQSDWGAVAEDDTPSDDELVNLTEEQVDLAADPTTTLTTNEKAQIKSYDDETLQDLLKRYEDLNPNLEEVDTTLSVFSLSGGETLSLPKTKDNTEELTEVVTLIRQRLNELSSLDTVVDSVKQQSLPKVKDTNRYRFNSSEDESSSAEQSEDEAQKDTFRAISSPFGSGE